MKKILVVDDEKMIRDLVGFRLRDEGYQIVSAQSGKEALARIEKEHPDLVVLDVMMPDICGIDVCKRIRARGAIAGVKILMLSALGTNQDIEAGIASGADAYMTKPFRSKQLFDKIEELIH